MSYRIGFDGVVSAELNHVLRAVESGLNGHGVGMLTRVQGAEEAAASAASSVNCNKLTKICGDGKIPTEPPNIVITSDFILVTSSVVVITLLIGLGIGYRLGKLAVTPQNRP